LAFLEEDEPLSPDATARGGRYGPPDRQRQFLFRRLIAVAIGVLILILLVLGIRGCLNAREERALENYGRDLDALAAESQQLSDNFFERLEDPGNLSELNFEAEVKADRGAAEGLVSRAEGLDPPGELKGAQADVVLAFELRRDGLAQISEQIGTALGDEGSTEATEAIAQDMGYFVASDVLYRRGQSQIEQVFEQEGIATEVPDSQFVAEDDLDYLDATVVSDSLTVITGETEAAGGGVHGLGLVPPALIGDAELVEGTPVTVTGGAEEVELSVQNQGDSEESDIPVTVEIDGSEAGEATIDTIEAGETQTVTVPLDPAPETGETVTLDVFVEPVAGEQVSDNNEASYEVTVE
jgi:hypothetical protein